MLECDDDRTNSPLYDYYVETDLDNIDEQPIDYSKRYADQDSDEVCGSSGKKRHLSSHSNPTNLDPNKADDELKVYCIEGTPLLISSASSLCDLREIGPLKQTFETDFIKEHKDKKLCYESPGMEDIEEGDCDEKCGELTESVLAQAEVQDECKSPKQIQECKLYDNVSKMSSPMMFSRCSSVGSLNSFEQHSFVDDRSSVSGFSALASGIVSPSDLPDSPGMMSPFIHKNKQEFVFPPTHNEKSMDPVLSQLKMNEAETFEDEAFEDIPEDSIKVYNDEGDCQSVSNLSALSIAASSTRVSVAVFQNKDRQLIVNNKSLINSNRSILNGNVVNGLGSKNDFSSSDEVCVDTYPIFSVFDASIKSISAPPNQSIDGVLCSESFKPNPSSPSNDHNGNMEFINDSGSLNSSKEGSDDEYDALLEECIKNGMPSTNISMLEESKESLNTTENNQISASEDNSFENNYSSENDDDASDDENVLMKQCIQVGMPKLTSSSDKDVDIKTDFSKDAGLTETMPNDMFLETTNSDDDEENDELLNQCIKLGMPKSPYNERGLDQGFTNYSSRIRTENQDTMSNGIFLETNNSDDDDEENDELLNQCIKLGMPESPYKEERLTENFTNYSSLIRTEEQEFRQNKLETESRKQIEDNEKSSFYQDTLQLPVSRNDILRNNSLNLKETHVSHTHNFQKLGFRDNNPDGTSDDEDDILFSQCMKAGMPVAKSSTSGASRQFISPNKTPYVKSLSQKKLTAFEDRAMYLRKCYSDDLMQSQFSGSRLMRAACIPLVEADDSTCVYQTEDTPLLSPTPSLSDLSTLSFTEDKVYQESYLNNSRNSDCSSESDDDELLLQCIRSGMPAQRRTFG